MSLPEAAEEVGVSVDTLRRAIHATDPAQFPPPLAAKRMTKRGSTDRNAPYRIPASALQAWIDSLPDA